MATGDKKRAVMTTDINNAGSDYPVMPLKTIDSTPDATHTGNLISSAAVAEGLATKVPVVGKGINLLDNAYFIGGGSQQGGGQFPINQRGQSSYSGEGNTIDRWYSTNGLTVQSSYINLPNAQISFGQRILKTLTSGLTLTFSALTDRGMKTGTIVNFDSSVNQQYWMSDDDVALYYDSLSTGIAGQFTIFNKYANCHIIAAKLELGPVQTLARQVGGQWVLNDPPPNFQTELAKCQRYYLHAYPVAYMPMKNSGARWCFATTTLPVPMRVIPSNSNTAAETTPTELYDQTTHTLSWFGGSDSYSTPPSMLLDDSVSNAIGVKLTINADL